MSDFFIPVIFYQQIPEGSSNILQPWGHAGWLQVNGSNGSISYYEFGPYASNGGGTGQLIKPDLLIDSVAIINGRPDISSVLAELGERESKGSD